MLDAKLLKKYKFVELNIFPDHVVCAFPYILAITQEAVEFRYAVNGSLLQSLCMPELKLITSKVSNFLRWGTFFAHIPWSIFIHNVRSFNMGNNFYISLTLSCKEN